MNGFLIYTAKRFGQFVFVVFTGVTLAFLITHLSPVDPIEQTLALLTNFGASDPRATEILRESLRVLYGVDGDLFQQYLAFWGRVLVGDFGPSLSAFPTPVMTVIRNALPWTAGLLILATLIAWVLGNTLGALAGYFRNNVALKVIGLGVMALQPIPTYILGLTWSSCSAICGRYFRSAAARRSISSRASTGRSCRASCGMVRCRR